MVEGPMDNICTIQAFTLWSIVFNMNITVLSMKVRERKSWLKAQHSENKDHGTWSRHFTANRRRNSANSVRLYLGGAPKSLQMVTAAMKLKEACSLEEKL